MRSLIVAAGLMLTLTGSVAAQPAPYVLNITTMGNGARSCGWWLEHGRPMDWAQGYLSRASAQRGRDLLRGQDLSGLRQSLAGFCREAPRQSLVIAVGRLELDLAKSAPSARAPAQ